MTKPVKLLWTGGWDSTFRLLYLVIIRKLSVQPIYVVEDKHRKSAVIEMATMLEVRDRIEKLYPGLQDLILPTCFINLNTIKIDPDVVKAFDSITKRYYLGGQYVYLASLCKQENFSAIEMGIVRHGNICSLLKNYSVKISDNGDTNYSLSLSLADESIKRLFGYYRFPMIDFTKTDLRDLAVKYGFLEILELSRSCHNPTRDKSPCGTCPPCSYAIEEGLTYRFPLRSRMRYYFSVKRRFYAWLRKYPYLFYLARKAKQKISGKKNVIR